MITPLQRAAWSGDLKAIRELLAAGADLEERSDGLTPLMFAAKEAKPLAVRRLIEAGADVNACVADEISFNGMSPLCFAVSAGGVRTRAVESTVRLLLKAGAEVDHRDSDGWTTLMNAVTRPRGRVVDLLLAAGADPNARSREGDTPLKLLKRAQAFRVFSPARAFKVAERQLRQAGALVEPAE